MENSIISFRSEINVERFSKLFIKVSSLVWILSLFVDIKIVISLLALISFLIVVVGIRKPSLGLIGISVLCTLDPMTREYFLTGGIFRWNTLNYWLLITIFSSLSLLIRINSLQIRLLTLFLIVLGLGLFKSQDFENGMQHILGIFITFGILIYFLRAIENKDAWYWSAIVCGWLSSVGGLFYFISQATSQEMNPNVWAAFPLTSIFIICLTAHIVSEQEKIATLHIFAAINFLWIFLSGSRSSLIICVVALIFLIISSNGVSKHVIILSIAMLGVIVLSDRFDSLYQEAIGRISMALDENYSIVQRTSGRSDLIIAGWNIFLKNPMGIGTGSFAPFWAKLGSLRGLLTFKMIGQEFSAHSGWVKVLAENGIPGIFLLGLFVISFIFSSWNERSFLSLGIMVTSCLTVGLFVTEFQSKSLWYLVAGSIVLINENRIRKSFAK